MNGPGVLMFTILVFELSTLNRILLLRSIQKASNLEYVTKALLLLRGGMGYCD